MVQDYTNQPYLDLPAALTRALAGVPVPRTGAVLVSAQGALTFLANRPDYPSQIADALPAIIVDINTSINVPYIYDEGGRLMRAVPIVVAAVVPNKAYLEGLTEAQRVEQILIADTDIKTLYGDLESLVNREELRRGVCRRLEIVQSPGIHDADFLQFSGNTRVHVRLAELWCFGWQQVVSA